MLVRKLFFYVMILSVVLGLPLCAQGKETLAVLDFTTEAVSRTEMGAIVEFLSAELFNTDKYIVIDVSQRETILNEMEFSMSGCSDDSCALEIGKLLSAELIVTGNLSKVGSRYLMSVKMLETETSRTVGTSNGKFGDLDELIDGLEIIAHTLAGIDDKPETETVAEQPQIEPEQSKTEQAATTAEESESQPSEDEETSQTVRDAAEVEKAAGAGDFNVPSFIVSALGAAAYTESGIFRSMSFLDRLNAEEAYAAYMSAVDPGQLYSGDGDTDYEHYYSDYERNTTISYITSGVGGALSPAAFYIGDSYMSFGGKLAYGIGALAFASGNALSTMSTNFAFNSISAYEDYMSAGSSSTEDLWNSYQEYYDSYEMFQYASYGLWGAGGLLSVASWFIPGEKTAAASGLIEKIILTAGYLFLAGGNFTSSLAVNARFDAEDAYSDYMSAGETATSDLFDTYQHYQETYEIMTYTSYGLWGAGAAAVIVAMLMPPENDDSAAAEANNFTVRPSLTGFGVEVDIKLK